MGRVKKPKDMAGVQARLITSQAKPVKLRVAASVVLNELTRTGRFTMRGPEYIAALTAAATRLAQVVDVYYVAKGKLTRIPDDDLVDGRFEDGGNLFRAASGAVFKSLSVRRGDVLEGIEVLRRAQLALDEAAAASPAPAEKPH
jgi:hypothetical protein